MSPELLVEARGAGARAPRLALDPASGPIVKEEQHTLIWKQALPDGTPAVVKLYRHRRPSVTVRLGLERVRAQHEFDALHYAERCGIPCSPPLFWAAGVDREQGRYALLATREVPAASSLDCELQSSRAPARDLDLVALFELVGTMHAKGLYHGMLETRNVLVTRDRGEARYCIIDLPRAIVFGGDLRGSRPARFDLAVLFWGLARFAGRERIAHALPGYGVSRGEATALVERLMARRMGRRYRNLVRASIAVRRGLGALRPESVRRAVIR